MPVNFGGFGNHNHHRHQHYGGQETVLSGNQSTQQLSCEELQQQREHAIDHKTKHDLDADTDEGDADHAFAITTATGGTGGAGSSTATPAWDVRFSELKQWKKVHDNTCVPKGEGPLGRWVARQRELKRTNSKFPHHNHYI